MACSPAGIQSATSISVSEHGGVKTIMRRLLTIAASTLALTLSGAASVALTASPAAAAGPVTVLYVGGANSDAVNSVGILTARVDSTAPISTMTARLLSGTTDVLDPALHQTSSDGYQSTWAVAAPIPVGTKQGELPLGDYTVNLSVTFTDSTPPVTKTDAGTYHFVETPWIPMQANHVNVSRTDPTVTITGQVNLADPDGKLYSYDPGKVLLQESWSNNSPWVPTSANGDFTKTVRPRGLNASVSARLATFIGGRDGSPDTIAFNVQINPALLTASLAAPVVRYPGKDTIHGRVTLQAKPGGPYVAAANETVQVYGTNGHHPVASGKTSSSGYYSFRLPATAGITWTVKAGGYPLDPFLAAVETTVGESADVPNVIRDFHLSLDKHRRLHYGGCLRPAEVVPNVGISDLGFGRARVSLQYALHPHGPWRTFRQRTPSFGYNRKCGSRGAWVHGTTFAPADRAYYRLHSSGTKNRPTPEHPKLLPSSSRKVLAWRYAVRIAHFSVSPHAVNQNQRITVKGQLQYYARHRWHYYAHRIVYIVYRLKGSSAWHPAVMVKTNGTGHFTARVKDWVGLATWTAQFNGNRKHLATRHRGVYVRVRGG